MHDHDENPCEQDESGEPSKSQQKRDMHSLQALGEALVKFPAGKLAELDLPDNLLEAIAQARRIKAHGALRRQMQYIGKLMRAIDPEPIREFIDRQANPHRHQTAQLHRAEKWRDRLLAGGDEVIDELLEEAPAADRQQLRQMVRNAHREQQEAKPPQTARRLFKYLRELLG